MMEGSGERATGTPNTIYDLASVLFHALEGGASYDQYIQDAEEAGDQELANFFRQVRDEDAARADEAQILLAERTPAARADSGAMSPEGMSGGIPPSTEPIAEDVPPPRASGLEEGALPGREDVPPPVEDRPLGTEGTTLPRTEERPLGAEEALLPDQERVRQAERDQGEDRGLVDRVRDALSGEEERGRSEGTGEPRRR